MMRKNWSISAGSRSDAASVSVAPEPLMEVSGVLSSWLTIPRNSARSRSISSSGVMSWRVTTTQTTSPSSERMGVALTRVVTLPPPGTSMTISSARTVSPVLKAWARTSVHNILTNEAYRGTLVWGINAKDNAEPVRVEKAFPAIITRAQFQRVGRHLGFRAPKFSHPRRVGSSYLLSGLLKCKTCKTPLTGRFAQSGKYSYYVCQSNIKLGKDACKTPTLNARRFEELVVAKIRSDILTEGNISELFFVFFICASLLVT